MRIARRSLTLILALVASLLLPTVTLAQGTAAANRDWSALTTIAPGSTLVAKLKNGKTTEGKLTAVTDTALSLNVKSKPTDLIRDDILTV